MQYEFCWTCPQLADAGRWQAHSLLDPLMVLLVDRLGDGNARGAQKGIRKGKKGKSVEENRLLLKLLSWPTLASSESTEVSFLGIGAYL